MVGLSVGGKIMLIDTRRDWERAKAARPFSLPEEEALLRAPSFRMKKDANGILFLSVDTRFKTYTFRYNPNGQEYPDELLEDWFRPGRWRKPTKRQLETLARRARHPMKGRKSVFECVRWNDTYPLALKRAKSL